MWHDMKMTNLLYDGSTFLMNVARISFMTNSIQEKQLVSANITKQARPKFTGSHIRHVALMNS